MQVRLTGYKCDRQAIARDMMASEDAGAQRRFSFYRAAPTAAGAARRANGLGMRIAVDIARGLAYLHSRKARSCFAVRLLSLAVPVPSCVRARTCSS